VGEEEWEGGVWRGVSIGAEWGNAGSQLNGGRDAGRSWGGEAIVTARWISDVCGVGRGGRGG